MDYQDTKTNLIQQGAALGFYPTATGLGSWLYDPFAAVGVFGISALLLVLGAVLIWLLVREPAH